MADIKIFAMNECDWMAAKSLEDAVRAYQEDFSGELDDDGPQELTADEMDELMFRETDSDDEPLEKKSFRVKLDEMIDAGESFPCFFASTEY